MTTCIGYEVQSEEHSRNTEQWSWFQQSPPPSRSQRASGNSNSNRNSSQPSTATNTSSRIRSFLAANNRNTDNNDNANYNDNDDDVASYFSDDQKSAGPEDTGQRKRKCAVWAMALYMLAAALIFLGVLLWRMGYIFNSPDSSHAKMQDYGTSNSTAGRFDEQGRMLCNGFHLNCFRRANEIMYATVHNAMSSRDDGFLAFNNYFPLEDALAAGFRGLTIDSCDCARIGVQLCHGLCLAGFRRPLGVFENIIEFLRLHPHEVVIIEIQVGEDSLGPLMELVQEVPGSAELLYQHPGGKDEPWPKLMDMIELGRRLIILAHDDSMCEEGSCPAGVHATYDYSFETPFEQKGIEELMRIELTCSVSRGWSNSDFVISNHFATDDRGLPNVEIAEQANAAENLQTRLDYCQEKFSTKYKNEVINLLVVDFWNVGDTLAVVDAYNRQLPPKTDAPSQSPSEAPTKSPPPTAAPEVIAEKVNVADILLSVAPSLAPNVITSAPAEEFIQLSTLIPTQATTQTETQAVTQVTTQTTTQAPTQATTQVPTQVATQVATQVTTQAATQSLTQAIATVTTSIPTFSSVNSLFDSILSEGEEAAATGATGAPTSFSWSESESTLLNGEEAQEDEPPTSGGQSFIMTGKDPVP